MARYEVHYQTSNNCRIISVEDPVLLAAYRAMPNCAVNPVTVHLRKVKMHHRKIIGGKVHPMTKAEIALVEAHQLKYGVDNDTRIREIHPKTRMEKAKRAGQAHYYLAKHHRTPLILGFLLGAIPLLAALLFGVK